MCNFITKISFIAVSCILFSACERIAPSPVDIKIDDSAVSSHVVTNNETLYDIAYKYNVDPANLASINNLQPPYTLQNGQVLQLPTEETYNNRGSDIVIKEGASAAGGYVALDNISENDIPSYVGAQEIDPKKEDESEEDFDSLILGGTKKAKEQKETAASKEKTEALSNPKVTKTALGAPVLSQKSTSSKKGHKKAEVVSEKNVKSSQKSSKMRMPVQGKIISHFGDVNDGISNDGINIQAKKGTEVSAAADGTVIYAGNKLDEEYGNVVIIQHDNGLITSYAHLDEASVKKDAHVNAGDKIGTVGSTGDVREPQLYFEVMKNKKPVNPSKYLKK